MSDTAAIGPQPTTLESFVLPLIESAYRIAWYLTSDAAAADRILQQSVVLTARGFEPLDPAAFRLRFLRLLITSCQTEYQLRHPLATPQADSDVPDHFGDNGEHPAPSSLRPDFGFMDVLDAVRIAKALQTLPLECLTVTTLHFVESLRYEEIAEIVGQPRALVRSRLHRGRRLLRSSLFAVAVDSAEAARVTGDTHSSATRVA